MLWALPASLMAVKLGDTLDSGARDGGSCGRCVQRRCLRHARICPFEARIGSLSAYPHELRDVPSDDEKPTSFPHSNSRLSSRFGSRYRLICQVTYLALKVVEERRGYEYERVFKGSKFHRL